MIKVDKPSDTVISGVNAPTVAGAVIANWNDDASDSPVVPVFTVSLLPALYVMVSAENGITSRPPDRRIVE